MPTSKKRKEQRKLHRSTGDSNAEASEFKESALDLKSLSSQEEIEWAASTQAVVLEENPEIQLRGVEGKGRGLFWCPSDGRTLPKGTTLLRLQPEMMVPDEIAIHTHCHVCYSQKGSDGGGLQCCPDCKLVHYCSKACKEADLPLHQEECKALISYRSNFGANASDPGSMIRQTARLVWQRKLSSEEWWKNIEGLLLHHDQTQGSIAYFSGARDVAKYLCGTRNIAGTEVKLAEWGYPDINELRAIYTRLQHSSYQAISAFMGEMGRSLSTVAAMINHSCAPNSVIVFPDGPGVKKPLHVVNLWDLKGEEEISVCYGDPCLPYTLRKKQYQNSFFFECSCSLCNKSERTLKTTKARVDPREATWCGRVGCNGWVALDQESSKTKGLCTGCKQPSILDEVKMANTLSEARDLMKWAENEFNLEKAANLLLTRSHLFKDLTAIQPPCAYPLLGVLNRFWPTLIHTGNDHTTKGNIIEAAKYRENGLRFLLLILAGMQAGREGGIIPEGHPTRAVILVQLSTIVIKPLSPIDAQWVTKNGSQSDLLSRTPMIPPPGQARVAFGANLVRQAVKEIKIGYGDDALKSDLYEALIDQLPIWAKPLVDAGEAIRPGVIA